ncbi:MAG TPA: hypothetical protein VMW75_08975 [Thermoanaerobaculia bacterium]|nr:hypothetical protein [Thermoanaerobaculia bacterium]
MELRFALLCGFALLLVGGVAATATPAEAPAAAPAAPAASATPAVSASPAACGLSLSVLGTSPPSLSLPQLNPAPLLLSTTCGACSKSPCQGAIYGQDCILQGRQGYGICITPYGNECSNGQPQCQCWFGPLP